MVEAMVGGLKFCRYSLALFKEPDILTSFCCKIRNPAPNLGFHTVRHYFLPCQDVCVMTYIHRASQIRISHRCPTLVPVPLCLSLARRSRLPQPAPHSLHP